MKGAVIVFVVLSFCCSLVRAQDVNMIEENLPNSEIQPEVVDTFPLLDLNEFEWDKIPDLRTRFERLNSSYSQPVAPSENLLRFLEKDEITLSPEAQYWVDWVRDSSSVVKPWMTLHDTMIIDPLFTPILFRGGLFPSDLQLYDKDFIAKLFPRYTLWKPDTTLFTNERFQLKMERQAYDYVRLNHPEYFRYSVRDLPTDIVHAHVIKRTKDVPELIRIEESPNDAFNDVDAPVRFLPKRRYWTSNFESNMQFAQAYFSKNWHDGNKQTNINLNTRNYFKYDYNKDKIKLTNELELKISANNAPKDTVRIVSITDNDLRIHSNFGYQAFGKWYYTFDLNINSKLFNTYNANDTVTRLSGFFAPLTITTSLGMKYNLDKKLPGNKYRKIHFDINLAPISMTNRYSRYKECFDFGRHGFDGSKLDDEGRIKNFQTYVGANIKANVKWQFNRNTSWTSRYEYDTSYHRVFWVWENRLEMAISRFFSTQINLNLRYDDAGYRNEDLNDTFLQVNESLTLGFSYRW